MPVDEAERRDDEDDRSGQGKLFRVDEPAGERAGHADEQEQHKDAKSWGHQDGGCEQDEQQSRKAGSEADAQALQ